MCKYCDVRMPDASGMEMDGKHHLMRILIAESGHIAVRADGLSVPALWDTFKVNYCPMCGKKLNESDDENVKWLVDDDYTGFFSDEKSAIRRCEELVDDGREEVELYRIRIESKKRCRMMTVWD